MPTIKLFASLRKIAGHKEISIAGATLNAVLKNLVQQHPALQGVILEQGRLRPDLILTVNGHNTSDPNLALAEDDTIAIFPPIAGG